MSIETTQRQHELHSQHDTNGCHEPNNTPQAAGPGDFSCCCGGDSQAACRKTLHRCGTSSHVLSQCGQRHQPNGACPHPHYLASQCTGRMQTGIQILFLKSKRKAGEKPSQTKQGCKYRYDFLCRLRTMASGWNRAANGRCAPTAVACLMLRDSVSNISPACWISGACMALDTPPACMPPCTVNDFHRCPRQSKTCMLETHLRL